MSSKALLLWNWTRAGPLSAETWKGVNSPTNPALFAAFCISKMGVNDDADLILRHPQSSLQAGPLIWSLAAAVLLKSSNQLTGVRQTPLWTSVGE